MEIKWNKYHSVLKKAGKEEKGTKMIGLSQTLITKGLNTLIKKQRLSDLLEKEILSV